MANMAKMGRPRLFATSFDLEQKLEEYGFYLQLGGYKRTWERLAAFLGCDISTLSEYEQRDGMMEVSSGVDGTTVEVYEPKEDYARLLKRERLSCTADLIDRVNEGKAKESLGIFLLKQKHYGGYTDKTEITHDGSIRIEIDPVFEALGH